MTPLFLAAIPALVAVLLWAIVDLQRFVFFAVLGVMVYPASLAQPAGTNIAAVDVLLLVGVAAWLINNSLGNAPNPQITNNPFLFPAVVFVAVSWVSLLWSDELRRTVSSSIQLIELLIVFPLMFASLPQSTKVVRQGFLVLIGVTCGMALALLATFVTHHSAQTQGTYLPGLNKNAAGSFLSAGLILAYVLQIRSRDATARVFLVAAMLIDIGGLIASESRGAMLGATAGLFVVSLLLKRNTFVAIALVSVLGALYLSVVAPGIAQKTSTVGSYNTSTARLHIWKNAIRKIEQRPFLGTGGGTYYDVQYGQGDPNNLFLLTWAEEGIPGLAALIWLLVSFGRLLARSRRLQDDTAAFLAVGAGGVTMSLLVHFQVDVSWSRGATSLAFTMVGIMVGLARLSSEHSLVSSSRPDPTPAPGDRAVLVGAP